MGLYNRHLLLHLVGSFAFYFLVLTLAAIGVVLMQLYRDFPSQGLGAIMASAPLLLGYVCPHTLAIAVAIAATRELGRVSASQELVALRASGVPQWTVLTPVILLAVVVASAAMLFNLILTPAAFRQRKQIEYEAALSILSRPPPGEQTLNLGPRYLLRYRRVKGDTLFEPFILERDEKTGAARFYYIGQRGRILLDQPDRPTLLLQEVAYGSVGGGEGGRAEEGLMDELPIAVERDATPPKITDMDAMTLRELRELAATAGGRTGRAALTKYHDLLAGSVVPVPLVLLAAGIGIGVRRSSLLAGMGASLPSLVVLYACRYFFTNASSAGTLPAGWGPYLAVGVIGAAAVGVLVVQCRR